MSFQLVNLGIDAGYGINRTDNTGVGNFECLLPSQLIGNVSRHIFNFNHRISDTLRPLDNIYTSGTHRNTQDLNAGGRNIIHTLDRFIQGNGFTVCRDIRDPVIAIVISLADCADNADVVADLKTIICPAAGSSNDCSGCGVEGKLSCTAHGNRLCHQTR